MSIRICPFCNKETEDDGALVCPECGMPLTSDENTLNTDDSIPLAEQDEFCQQTDAEPDKKVRVIASVVAAIMVIAVVVFGWYMFSKYQKQNPKNNPELQHIYAEDLVFEDIDGIFADEPSGMYFDFRPGKEKLEIPDESVDSSASSDGISSDAAYSPETKTIMFDGTYESGFTEDYVKRVLVSIYINENGMLEEYEEYVRTKGVAGDDYLGYAEEKGISQDELDKIDRANGISLQGDSYKETGYWSFDGDNKEIKLYRRNGDEMASLKIVGGAIVDPTGYLKEDLSHKNIKKYTYDVEGYSETISFYTDGNYIAKTRYNEKDAQFYAGEYKEDALSVVMHMNGEKMPYTKVRGGISFITYIRQ